MGRKAALQSSREMKIVVVCASSLRAFDNRAPRENEISRARGGRIFLVLRDAHARVSIFFRTPSSLSLSSEETFLGGTRELLCEQGCVFGART